MFHAKNYATSPSYVQIKNLSQRHELNISLQQVSQITTGSTKIESDVIIKILHIIVHYYLNRTINNNKKIAAICTWPFRIPLQYGDYQFAITPQDAQ